MAAGAAARWLLLAPAASAAAAGAAAAPSAPWGDWIPRTEAWHAYLNRLEEQIKRMESNQERFDAYINIASAGIFVPNFTEHGYQVVKQPPSVHQRLNASLYAGIAKGLREEGAIDQIAGPVAQFVDLGSLTKELLEELLPQHEAWAGGVPLSPKIAYGLRLYGPGNWLTMHFDRMETHVISSILHVDRDVDEPWPIVIECYDGKTVEVDLKPGEMLFYESAKCMHGRPRPLNGRFYTSLFMHYAPKDWKLEKKDIIALLEKHGLWRKGLPPDGLLPALRMKGTGFFEPDCPDHWCSLAGTAQPAAKTGGTQARLDL